MAQFNTYDEAAALAQEYALAILPLAQQQGNVDETLAELEEVEKVLREDGDIRLALESPMLAYDTLIKLIEKTFRGRASDLVTDALVILARNGRMAIVPSLVRALRTEAQRAGGLREVEVTTAVPMDEKEKAAIAEAIRARIGCTPILRMVVDETLLGGLRVRVGDEVIDASVAGQLERMKESMLRRQMSPGS